jgi:SAM-dependent methyltransferase
MTFAVQAEVYDRFVGRYGAVLGRELAGRAGAGAGMRVLDVGAGTGKLTGVLVDLVGAENVAAVDPSEPFATALRGRFPLVEVHEARAENLPFADESFDAALAQLVFNFVSDPAGAAAEMRRVARRGGSVAAAVWDYSDRMPLLARFWEAAATVDAAGSAAHDERSRMRFAVEGGLGELWAESGLEDVQHGAIVVTASYEGFEDLWEPFTLGVGPAGAYAAALEPEAQAALRDEYRRRLGVPDGPFELEARAWYAVGRK